MGVHFFYFESFGSYFQLLESMYCYPRIIDNKMNINTPTCVYSLDNIHGNGPCVSNIDLNALLLRQNSIDQRLSCLVQNMKRIELSSKNCDPDIDSLSLKQSNIEARLDKLVTTLRDFSKKNGLPFSVDCNTEVVSDELDSSLPKDFVLYASPSSPPLSVLLLIEELSKKYKINVYSYKHSSMGEYPGNVPFLGTYIESGLRSDVQLVVSIIWKQIKTPSLVINPAAHVAVHGESNISRFITRLMGNLYDELSPKVFIVDSILDIASRILYGELKDKSKAISNLEELLKGGVDRWLIAEQMTIADIVLWSAITQNIKSLKLNSNLSKWFDSCNNQHVFINVKKFSQI